MFLEKFLSENGSLRIFRISKISKIFETPFYFFVGTSRLQISLMNFFESLKTCRDHFKIKLVKQHWNSTPIFLHPFLTFRGLHFFSFLASVPGCFLVAFVKMIFKSKPQFVVFEATTKNFFFDKYHKPHSLCFTMCHVGHWIDGFL